MELKFDRATKTVVLEGAGSVKWRTPSDGELDTFEFGVERSFAIYSILVKAIDAFENGTADYTNAVERLDALHDQSNRATTNLFNACNLVSSWVGPVKVLQEQYEGKAQALLEFCRSWIREMRDERKPSPSADTEK